MLIELEHIGVCDGDLCFPVNQHHLRTVDHDKKVVDIIYPFYKDVLPKKVVGVYASYICNEDLLVRVWFRHDKALVISATDLTTADDNDIVKEETHKRGNIRTLKLKDLDKVLEKHTKWVEQIKKPRKRRKRRKKTEV